MPARHEPDERNTYPKAYHNLFYSHHTDTNTMRHLSMEHILSMTKMASIDQLGIQKSSDPMQGHTGNDPQLT
jgi:hypothetical protein